MTNTAFISVPSSGITKDGTLTEQFIKTIAKLHADHPATSLISPMFMGYAIIPHLSNQEATWSTWGNHCERLIEASDELWVIKFDGWENSTGVTMEIAHARHHNKPVAYVELDGIITTTPIRDSFVEDKLFPFFAKSALAHSLHQDLRAQSKQYAVRVDKVIENLRAYRAQVSAQLFNETPTSIVGCDVSEFEDRLFALTQLTRGLSHKDATVANLQACSIDWIKNAATVEFYSHTFVCSEECQITLPIELWDQVDTLTVTEWCDKYQLYFNELYDDVIAWVTTSITEASKKQTELTIQVYELCRLADKLGYKVTLKDNT